MVDLACQKLFEKPIENSYIHSFSIETNFQPEKHRRSLSQK